MPSNLHWEEVRQEDQAEEAWRLVRVQLHLMASLSLRPCWWRIPAADQNRDRAYRRGLRRERPHGRGNLPRPSLFDGAREDVGSERPSYT